MASNSRGRCGGNAAGHGRRLGEGEDALGGADNMPALLLQKAKLYSGLPPFLALEFEFNFLCFAASS